MRLMAFVKPVLFAVLLVPLLIVLAPLVVGILFCTSIAKKHTRWRLLRTWPQEKYILFTYSDSPNWSEFIETNIIPKIEQHAIIINRTKNPNWKHQFKPEKRAIELWATLNANPLAIVFEPNGKTEPIEFYEAFRDLKHGKDKAINEKCTELLRAL